MGTKVATEISRVKELSLSNGQWAVLADIIESATDRARKVRELYAAEASAVMAEIDNARKSQ